MKILVCGQRDFLDKTFVFLALDEIHAEKPITCVVNGGAPGADSLGAAWAHAKGIEVKTYKAQWARFGKGAGPIRNQQMLDEEKPDYALVLYHDPHSSKGTNDMQKRLDEASVPYKMIIKHDANLPQTEPIKKYGRQDGINSLARDHSKD